MWRLYLNIGFLLSFGPCVWGAIQLSESGTRFQNAQFVTLQGQAESPLVKIRKLRSLNDNFFSGVIISNRSIITSAHSLRGLTDFSHLMVEIAIQNPVTNFPFIKTFRIESVQINLDYNQASPPANDTPESNELRKKYYSQNIPNDIAVIKLSEDIPEQKPKAKFLPSLKKLKIFDKLSLELWGFGSSLTYGPGGALGVVPLYPVQAQKFISPDSSVNKSVNLPAGPAVSSPNRLTVAELYQIDDQSVLSFDGTKGGFMMPGDSGGGIFYRDEQKNFFLVAIASMFLYKDDAYLNSDSIMRNRINLINRIYATLGVNVNSNSTRKFFKEIRQSIATEVKPRCSLVLSQ